MLDLSKITKRQINPSKQEESKIQKVSYIQKNNKLPEFSFFTIKAEVGKNSENTIPYNISIYYKNSPLEKVEKFAGFVRNYFLENSKMDSEFLEEEIIDEILRVEFVEFLDYGFNYSNQENYQILDLALN